MSFKIDLKNKIVIITGVSSGIGLGAVKEFAKAGASIVGCSRKPVDDPAIDNFRNIAQEYGIPYLYVQTDVTQLNDLENLVQQAINRFSRIDILISNAGKNVFKECAKCSEEIWQYNLDLNLTSHWRLSKLCKPYLEQSENGTIILMTSNHAYSTISGCFPYSVTKTAITGLVRCLSIEWGPKIHTVGIAPGFIETAGNDTWFNSFPNPSAERERTINLHPVKKLGTVSEVGALCVFLASHYACFISGTTILMDGGRSAMMQDDV